MHLCAMPGLEYSSVKGHTWGRNEKKFDEKKKQFFLFYNFFYLILFSFSLLAVTMDDRDALVKNVVEQLRRYVDLLCCMYICMIYKNNLSDHVVLILLNPPPLY